MSMSELIPLVASIASLILAVIAIWLSITFFKLSSRLLESTTEATRGIGSSVDRLEKLFDHLYADTFSMMRDTVSDMRKHIWPTDTPEKDRVTEEADRKADMKVQELKREITEELTAVFGRQKITEARMENLMADTKKLLDRVIESSRQVDSEAREETLREAILRVHQTLRHKYPNVRASALVDRLDQELPSTIVEGLFEELERLKNEGVFSYSEPLKPGTIIRYTGIDEPHGHDQSRHDAR